VVTTPFGEVNFANSWIADQLNSLSLVIVDLQYVLCFYINEVEWTGFNGKYQLDTIIIYLNLPACYSFICLQNLICEVYA